MKNQSVILQIVWWAVAGSAALPAAELVNPTNAVRLTPEYLSRLAEEMRTNHPALLAARARATATAAGVDAVRTWEDPVVRLGGMAADSAKRADDGDLIYGAEQKLPLFGKPGLARNVARAESKVEFANADYQFQIQRSDLAKAAFRTALADQVVVIGEQDLAWLKTMAGALESKYRVSEATLFDLLQVQNEQGKRATQLQTDRENLGHARVGLNRFLNRDLTSGWPALQLPPVAGPIAYSETLADYASRYEPKLRMMREQVNQAQALADATRRQRWPEVSAGVESRNYTGNGDWRQAEFMLNFSLPLFNTKKYRADVRREEARREAAAFDAADYALSLREEVHSLTVKIDAARREALLYRDEVIPRSQSALESVQADWQSGRSSFRDVLDVRRMLLEGRLMYARAVAEQYEMMSELVLCCGLGELGSLERLGALPEFEPEKKP